MIRSPMPVKHFINVRHRSVTCLDVWIPVGNRSAARARQSDMACGRRPDTLRAMYAEQLDDEDDFMTVVAGDGLYYLIEWDRRASKSFAAPISTAAR